MKTLIVMILVVLGVSACEPTASDAVRHGWTIGDFIQEESTGLCFLRTPQYMGYGYATVPCSEAVMAKIRQR